MSQTKKKKFRIIVFIFAILIFLAGVGFFLVKKNILDLTYFKSNKDTEQVYTVPSKYKDIQVKTIQEESEDKRYLLSISWPVTENPTINRALDAQANSFINDYHSKVTEIKQARADYEKQYGKDGATFHVDYESHFDVAFADEKYLAFTFDNYINTGNTGEDKVSSIIYNRQTGEVIPLAQLFKDQNYLQQLSQLSRSYLYKKVEAEAEDGNFSSKQAKTEWIKDLEKTMVDPGTEPTAENFHSVTTDGENMIINFDKYQVAPGYWGTVSVKIPLTKISNLFTPEVRKLFNLQVKEETPSDEAISSRTDNQDLAKSLAYENTWQAADCSVLKCIALTFDDGPSVYTDQLLDILNEKQIKATFFVMGITSKVEQATLIREVKSGMEIGDHTWDHKDLTTLPKDKIKSEVKDTADLIEKITGIRPYLVRPPYGAVNSTVKSVLSNPFILWNADPDDWKVRDADKVADSLIAQAKPGAILLSHDIYKTTVEAIPKVIDTLQKEGYTFVTVSQMLGPKNIQADTQYYDQFFNK